MKTLHALFRTGRLLCATLLAFAGITSARASDSNAAWLTQAYVTSPEHIRLVPDLATRLKALRVTHLFVKTAALGGLGVVEDKPAHLLPFLDALGRWETANQHRFTVLLCLTSQLDEDGAQPLDLAVSATRNALVTESLRYMDPGFPGSPLAKARRPADGVLLDLDGSGADDARFKQLGLLFQNIREARSPEHKIGFVAPPVGTRPGQFSYVYYHYLARNVDLIVGKNYGSGLRTSDQYQTWIEEQTRVTLRAVSGAAWKFDSQHPAPTGVKVFIGFPAYPADAAGHLKGAELLPQAAAGTLAGLASIDARSRAYFEGAAVHAHDDGVSTNGYALWDKDWADFRDFWLTP